MVSSRYREKILGKLEVLEPDALENQETYSTDPGAEARLGGFPTPTLRHCYRFFGRSDRFGDLSLRRERAK